MSKYIKGLYGKTERVLNENESLAAKAAALLGVTEEDIASTVEGLTFSDYLALGNAVDVEDVADANRILGMDGLEEGVVKEDFFGGGGFNPKHIAQANKAALAKQRQQDQLQKKLDKQEWDRKYGTKKKAAVKPDLWKIAQIIMDEVGNAVPDVDPIDLIVPKVARMLGHGSGDPWDHPSAWDVVPILDKAARKYLHVKDYNEYLANMWDSYAEIMPPEEREGWSNPWRADESINEADNPYVTPPSAGLPSKNLNKGQSAQDKGEELARSKDVDDLMFGDEIEVADIDGQPSPAKVVMPKGPGNTVAVRGKGGVEVMVKKDSIIGTPKINESRGTYKMAGWSITDNSKLGGGSDPTWITRWTIKGGDQYRPYGHPIQLEIEEIFGDWYITDVHAGGRSHPLSTQEANEYLMDYGMPSIDQIGAFVDAHSGPYGDAENGPSPRDLGEGFGCHDAGEGCHDTGDWDDDEKFDAQQKYDYHKRQYDRLVKSQGWHGGVSGTEVYNRDWKKEAAQHKREAAKYKKIAGITESKSVDNQGKTCTKCKKGKYEETSVQDDWDGVLHCNKCNHEVKRHITETASGGATGAGAIATAPAATGGVQKRNPSIYGKPAPKQKSKKKEDGIGRNRKQ